MTVMVIFVHIIFLTEPLSNKDTDSEEDEDFGPKPFNPTAAGLSQKE